MVEWIKRFFKIKPKNKYAGFKIEYFHASQKYYPLYRGQFLYTSPINEGGYTTTSYADYAKSSSTEEGAKRIIDHCIESKEKHRIIKL